MQTKFRQEQKGDAEAGWCCNLPAPGLDEGSIHAVLQNRLWFRKEPSGPGPGAAEALKVPPLSSSSCSQEDTPAQCQRRKPGHWDTGPSGWRARPKACWACQVSAHSRTGAAAAPALTRKRTTSLLRDAQPMVTHVRRGRCAPACFHSFLTQRSHGKSQHVCGNHGFREIAEPAKCDRNSRSDFLIMPTFDGGENPTIFWLTDPLR